MMPLRLRLERVPTPIGQALLVTDELDRVRAVDWHDHETRLHRLLRLHYRTLPPLEQRLQASGAARALEAYFDGDLDALQALPVATGGTTFQRLVWTALRAIPPGATIPYAELARRIGKASAVRAVGLAVGANPVGLVIPCHRVVGRSGALTGYAGGLDRKAWLLDHERAARRATAVAAGTRPRTYQAIGGPA
ncbi:MAG TPA: methylated-DNA--[protein]-cysteine S-methyltransferase [Vicinamibacterales bacterium]